MSEIEISFDQFEKSLNNVKTVELWWYQKDKQPFNIGLVLVFEHQPLYTIDFDIETNEILHYRYPVLGGKKEVHFKNYQRSFQLIGYLTTFNKSEALQFAVQCAQFAASEYYQLVLKNSRDFVEIAIVHLREQKKIDEKIQNNYRMWVSDMTTNNNRVKVKRDLLIFFVSSAIVCHTIFSSIAQSTKDLCFEYVSAASSYPNFLLNEFAFIVLTALFAILAKFAFYVWVPNLMLGVELKFQDRCVYSCLLSAGSIAFYSVASICMKYVQNHTFKFDLFVVTFSLLYFLVICYIIRFVAQFLNIAKHRLIRGWMLLVLRILLNPILNQNEEQNQSKDETNKSK